MDKNVPGYEERPIMYKGYPVFGRLTTPYFDRIPKEYIQNEACFIFVDQGELALRGQEGSLDLNTDSAVLGKCMNYFFETSHEQRKKGGLIQMTAVLLFPAIVEELFDFDLSGSRYVVNYNVKQVQVDKLLQNFRDSLDILFEHPELADEGMIRNKLKEFILIISKSESAPSHFDFLSAMYKPHEVEFKTVIQNNLYSTLTIEELAALCHLSTSSFKRKFKEVFDDTPKKYLNKKKVEKAANLLLSSNERISQIAYESGFDTLSTFNRTFRAAYGFSPSNYRLNQTA